MEVYENTKDIPNRKRFPSLPANDCGVFPVDGGGAPGKERSGVLPHTCGGASRKPDEGERAVHFKNLHRCVPVTHDKETGRSGETSVTEPVVNEIEPTEG